ncbi:chromate efflux transporter [Ruegeria marina]|uniref:Chromate transporter n=1 Tax=Ruegeria marina TaxID=639004 RepID=A0A1G6XSX4_9RHOB|nr:chromate efflux transporter [Ruegeria marina]SDD80456.1 chromate transporter [Ruegeria marina]
MTPSWRNLVQVFGRIGLLSFGGPAAQISLMLHELVEQRRWLDEKTFLRALSLCMLLPGPEAMQLATYAGWRLRGIPGGLISGGLFVLPGALVIAALVALYVSFGDLPLVQSAFLGIKAAVIVIVVQALHKLGVRALTSGSAWIIAGLAFVSIFLFSIPFPLIVAAAGLWGFVSTSSKAPAASGPDGGRFRIGPVLFWSALWLCPLLWLSLQGPALLADLGWFFAKLAVVTFGGAYAVLAYMTQTVVDQHHWISTGQMIDALGLAETTPGPLILVTQFVAMLAGYLAEGPAMALAAGLVALWATFVPCFLWIFTAAPYLDRIAGRPRPAAALAAITAAVVGVILNLSTWFALHVFFAQTEIARIGPMSFPLPIWSDFEPVAAVLSGVAAVWLLLLRRGMGETLLLSSLAGLACHAL